MIRWDFKYLCFALFLCIYGRKQFSFFFFFFLPVVMQHRPHTLIQRGDPADRWFVREDLPHGQWWLLGSASAGCQVTGGFSFLIGGLAKIFLRALKYYLFCNLFMFASPGLHEAGEPTLPGADAGQEADVRSQSMDTLTVFSWRHSFLCW